MGTATAPVAGSGSCPTWMARVSKARASSSSSGWRSLLVNELLRASSVGHRERHTAPRKLTDPGDRTVVAGAEQGLKRSEFLRSDCQCGEEEVSCRWCTVRLRSRLFGAEAAATHEPRPRTRRHTWQVASGWGAVAAVSWSFWPPRRTSRAWA